MEIQERRIIELNNKVDAIFNAAKAENRQLTAAEDYEIERVADEFRSIQDDGNFSRRRSEPDNMAAVLPLPTRYSEAEPMPRSVTGRKTAADVFGSASARGSSGFRSFGDFIRTVGNGLHHTGLQSVSADWQEGAGESGGYYVPDQYSFNLFNNILEKSVVLGNCEVFPMSSNTLVAPHFDYSNHNTIGGFPGFQWLAELQEATDQDGALKALTLHAHKIGIYTQASLELISDAGPVFSNKLEQTMSDSAAFGIDTTLLRTGTGVGQPLAILNSPALITAAAAGGQAADTVLFDNVLSMYSRVLPSSQVRGSWFVHPSVIPQLFKMAIVDNAAAILGPALDSTFQQTGPGAFSLMGRPVVVSEKMAVLGDVGDILFADLSQYVVGLRKAISIERNIAAGWQRYAEKFRLIMRLDGTTKDSSVTTPVNGATLSPFVTLAAR